MRICTVDGCGKKHFSKGYCTKHYARSMKYGDPNKTAKDFKTENKCKIEGCTNKYYAKGFCSAHYETNRRNNIEKGAKLCSLEICNERHFAKGYCNKHYRRFMETGDPLKTKNRKCFIDFDINANGCFICTSHKYNDKGYPTMRVGDRMIYLSRFVYEQMFGEIPKGLLIRHTCDDPRCINPEHLLTGTHLDNTMDKLERNRQTKGEDVHCSKLKEEDVLVIRSMLNKGTEIKEIASLFNVSYSTIRNIKAGKRWVHVGEKQ